MEVEVEDAGALLLSRRWPADPCPALPELALDHAGRMRTRLRVEVQGQCFAILLPPGPPLDDGELLGDAAAARLRIRAAAEPVVVVYTDDPRLLARAAWHLGNRHVPVEVDAASLALKPDHVLEAMLRGLGLEVRPQRRPFRPEPGAYHGAHPGGNPALHAPAPLRPRPPHGH